MKRRRKRAPEREQKGKNRSRPRGWHRGPATATPLERLEPAFKAADRDRAEVEKSSTATRAEIRDHRELIASLEHVAPFVPSWV